MSTLAELRAKLLAQETKAQNNQNKDFTKDSLLYPHWNIPEGSTATIRFLPDGDATNEFFWKERLVIKLPFSGIKGQVGSKKVEVTVPCMEMYGTGESCPILTEIRPWYKDDAMKQLANRYWKKKAYFFQGFVRANPIGDDVTPPNPIRKFVITPQIMPIIRQGLLDPEIDEMPTHPTRGLDFIVRKTLKGEHFDYNTSNWARKESALTEAELAAIETHGLFNLNDWLPKKPTAADLVVIKEMFEASVEGEEYDVARWGNYYRPYGIQVEQNTTTDATAAFNNVPKASVVEAAAPKTTMTELAEVDDTDNIPFDTTPQAPKTTTSDKASDILAMIRSRQQKA